MKSLGNCPLCEDGPLGLRRCGVCRRVVVLCEECDIAWRGPQARGKPTITAPSGETPCPDCRADLFSRGSVWIDPDKP